MSSPHNSGIRIKNSDEIEAMRCAGEGAAKVLLMVEEHIRVGVTTGEIDDICREYILGPLGCESATIGYTAGGSRPPSLGRSALLSIMLSVMVFLAGNA